MSHNNPESNEPKAFDYSAPSNVVYEQEAPVRAGRFSATTLVTTGLLIAGGLVGGAAFALTNAPQLTSPVAPAAPASQPAVANATSVSAASPAPTASATDAPAAPAASSVAATPDAQAAPSGKTIAVPPAAFDDKSGSRDFHPAPGSAPAAGTSGSAGSAPSFGSGEHDNEVHHKPNDGKVRQPASGTPSFGDGSDETDGND